MKEQHRICLLWGGVVLLLVALPAILFLGGPPNGQGESNAQADVRIQSGHAGPARRSESIPGPVRGAASKSEARDPSGRSGPPFATLPDPPSALCLEVLTSGIRAADRERAARLLGRRSGEEGLAERAVPVLLTAMENDEKPRVRLEATRALGQYGAGGSAAVPALVKLIDPQTVGEIAIQALGRIGPEAEAAIEPISRIARDAEARISVRSKAIQALVRIGGPEHPGVATVLQAARRDPDRRLAVAVREAVNVRAPEATEPVAEPSPDQGVVLASRRGGGRSLTPLGPQGGEPSPQRREPTAAVESQPGDQEAVLAGRRETDSLAGRGAPASKSDGERQELLAELEAIKKDRQELAAALEELKEERQELAADLEKVKKERQQLVVALEELKSPASPGGRGEVDKPLAVLPPKSGTVDEENGPGNFKEEAVLPSSKPVADSGATPAPVAAVSVATKQSAPKPKAPPRSEPTSTSKPQPPPAKTVRYRIARGDTLSKIGRKYSLSTSVIAKANGISNPNKIRVGQVLTIPAK